MKRFFLLSLLSAVFMMFSSASQAQTQKYYATSQDLGGGAVRFFSLGFYGFRDFYRFDNQSEPNAICALLGKSKTVRKTVTAVTGVGTVVVERDGMIYKEKAPAPVEVIDSIICR